MEVLNLGCTLELPGEIVDMVMPRLNLKPTGTFLYFPAAAKSLQSCPTLSDPMDCSHQAPSSMGFSRQEYWSGVPLPSLGNPNKQPRWEPTIQIRLSNLSVNLHMENLQNSQLLGPISRVSNSVFVGWGRVTSISDLFPGDPDTSGQGTVF